MAVVRNLMVRSGADFSALYKEMQTAQKRMNAFKKGITKAMKSISIALGGLAVGKLVKDSLNAASELEGAFVGLESILTGQGRSFSKAKAFINDYIQDGLIPLTDAITAYKNLAARGYNDEQIQQVLERLKDAAAFGRQSSYTLGEAVRTATEGLKNENSILVDNAGVTKNVSKMWEEYAKSIGKTRNQLTQQEKIQAEVNGILKETQWQVGDAAKYADTYAGRLAALGKTLRDIKINLGNAFMPIVNTVLPVLQTLFNWLSRVTAAFAAFSQALFGKAPKVQAKATQAQAQAMEELGDATEDAAKKANKNLQAFDEFHELQKDTGDAGVGAFGGFDTGPVAPIGMEDAGEPETFYKMQETLEKIAVLFDPAIDGFTRIKEAAGPVIQNIGEGIKWFYDNILVPFGTWVISEAVPSFMDLLSGALNVLNPILEVFKSLGQWLWESFLQPAGEWAGETLLNALDWLADALKRIGDWMSEHKGVIEAIAIVVGSFAAAWGLVNLAIGIWNVIGAIAAGVTSAFGAAVAFLTSPIGLVVLAIGAVIAIVVLLIKHWDDVKAAAKVAWEWIKETWSKVADWFQEKVIDPVKKAFNKLGEGISKIWEGIWGSVKSFINGIIDGLNKLIKGLNKVKFDIPDWVPLLGGKTFGINIPEIPKLEVGTNYVPKDMMAYLHEGEAVVPKKYNPAAAAGGGGDLGQVFKKAMLEALMQRDIIAGGSEGRELRVTMVLENGEVLADMLINPMNRTAKNRGFAPVFRPAT